MLLSSFLLSRELLNIDFFQKRIALLPNCKVVSKIDISQLKSVLVDSRNDDSSPQIVAKALFAAVENIKSQWSVIAMQSEANQC